MVAAAEQLAKPFDQIRVDLYDCGGEVYFSELTSYDGSGYSYFCPEDAPTEPRPSDELDHQLGALWALPRIPLSRKLLALLRR